MIQHIVLFNPKAGLSADQQRSFAQSAEAAIERSPHVARFTLGERVDIDAGYARPFGDKTYQFAAVLEFGGPEALIDYLNSPDHAELGRLFWELCESAVVVEVDASAGSVDRAVKARRQDS